MQYTYTVPSPSLLPDELAWRLLSDIILEIRRNYIPEIVDVECTVSTDLDIVYIWFKLQPTMAVRDMHLSFQEMWAMVHCSTWDARVRGYARRMCFHFNLEFIANAPPIPEDVQPPVDSTPVHTVAASYNGHVDADPDRIPYDEDDDTGMPEFAEWN